jgi:hypothetical protein
VRSSPQFGILDNTIDNTIDNALDSARQYLALPAVPHPADAG